MKRDILFVNKPENAVLGGKVGYALSYITENQMLDSDTWDRFVSQFDCGSDDWNYGWRCEYWGKMMRAAALVQRDTGNERLYEVITDSVEKILKKQDSLGRISSYSTSCEFNGWDMWGRKYVLLGMQFYLDICRDEKLKARVLDSMKKQADYIISKVGHNGTEINKTSTIWLGINSMSVLEPVVMLYNLTGEKRYLDFASYIVETGFETESCIFRYAYEDKVLPHKYPVNKAYEMISCFEGLIEYYRVTGDEKCFKAAVNFGRRVLETEISIIGSSGCTHELFDGTRFHETDEARTGIMQETCVTVTLIKFCGQMLRLTGEVMYADCMERSFYNAYLGSFNTKKKETRLPADGRFPAYSLALPFDSYSPLRKGFRGMQTGGLQRMAGGAFYGCCACIAGMGAAVLPQYAVMNSGKDMYICSYCDGEIKNTAPDGNEYTVKVSGGYPYKGSINVEISTEKPSEMTVWFRIPEWSINTEINGEIVRPGWYPVSKIWNNETVNIIFDTEIYPVYPIKSAVMGERYVGYRKGPVVLCADSDTEEQTDISVQYNGMTLVDYASAGKSYDPEKPFAAWIKR